VAVALAPGFLRGLGKLPVIETGSESAGNGLRMFRPLIMAETIVGKAQRFGQQPAFTVVLI